MERNSGETSIIFKNKILNDYQTVLINMPEA